MTIILTKEDAQQNSFFRKFRRANRWPAVTEFKFWEWGGDFGHRSSKTNEA
jgi:hypothetical protein